MSLAVVGSACIDLVFFADRIPSPGETILGQSFLMNAGGKGANQAVAAAKMGGSVEMVACLGNDGFGGALSTSLSESGVGLTWTKRLEQATSTAGIFVGNSGENCIIVAPGAAQALTREMVREALVALKPDWILCQGETALETVEEATYHGKVLLNAAPVFNIPDDIYPKLEYLIVNETEAEQLSGLSVGDADSALQAARLFIERGVKGVIVTLGPKGALWMTNQDGHGFVQAPKVKVIDTTAAGDCFTGVFAALLDEGMDAAEAAEYACAAASLSVTKPGAQASLPTREQLRAFLPTKERERLPSRPIGGVST